MKNCDSIPQTRNLKPTWGSLNSNYLRLKELGVSLDFSRTPLAQDGKSIEKLASDQPIGGRCDNELSYKRALGEILEIENGDLANTDEGRMVGHYWLRAPELSPNPGISDNILKEVDKLKAFASDARKRFKQAIIIGIGGSSLGPMLLESAFEGGQDFKLVFLDNTDPDGIKHSLSNLPHSLKDSLVIAISKSGSTPETANGLREVKEVFSKANLNLAQHCVAITLEGSKLDKQAEAWLESFYIWDWVGGRTSITSAVGLLPLELMGCSSEDFLSGASSMDTLTRGSNPAENPAWLLALSWIESEKNNLVVLPYRDRLITLSRYLQQLLMESLGKDCTRKGEPTSTGLSVLGNKGSTDQHALVQQLREGRNDFNALFLEVLEDKHPGVELSEEVYTGDYLASFAHGTREALSEKGRYSTSITLDKLNEKSLGAVIALFERATSFMAIMLDINAYNQPGVEAGKKEAKKVLELKTKVLNFIKSLPKGESFTTPEIVSSSSNITEDETESVFRILERLSVNKNLIARKNLGSPAETSYERV